MMPIWHDGPLSAVAEAERGILVWSVADPGRGRRCTLATALLARRSGYPAGAAALARSMAGAPLVVHPHGWHLALAGRGERCLIGVANEPIAVDREIVDTEAPLWDMLTEDEVRAVRRAPQDMQERQWLRRWTIKEAHAKLTGDPRRVAPETINTRVIDEVRATAHRETAKGKEVSRCWTRNEGDAIETVACWAVRA